MNVARYLDCGCVILDDGGFSLCPTCENPPAPPETPVLAAQPPPDGDGVALIARERARQITAEGYNASHDDLHLDGSLAKAAACYSATAATQSCHNIHSLPACFTHRDWPWGLRFWKPSNDPVINLTKAGALIAAEIDRLLRLREAIR